MALKPCKKCGNQISAGAKACPSCGAKLEQTLTASGAAALLLLVLLIGYMIFGPEMEKPPPVTYSDAPFPVETGAHLSQTFINNGYEALVASVVFIKAHGNRCDSVSFAYVSTFDGSFTMKCNFNKYVYEIKDVGGNFKLTVVR